jgi:uncharacterized membrane protein YfcA
VDLLTGTLAVVGGFAAGMINTLAGNGSAITLSIMTELLGLPANIANGTNRVGVLTQCWAASISFVRNGKVDIKTTKWPIVFAVLGAVIGIWVAVSVSNEQFKNVFKYILVLMLLVILIKPKRWLIEHSVDPNMSLWITGPLFFALGFYGGFIQMGMGVLFLVTTVLILKYNLIRANALKTVVIAVYSVLAVFLFHWHGYIDWKVGLTIAFGQTIGGYITAEIASKHPGIEIWAYRLLVFSIVAAICSVFGLFR